MENEKRIHQKNHIPVARDRFLISDLVLVESQVIFRTLIELIDLISETPTPQQKRRIAVGVIGHQHIDKLHILFFGGGFDNQYTSFACQILYLQPNLCDIDGAQFPVCLGANG